ncbi:Molybdopterin or thiamine biosynthesis adenylyltransferase [Cognatiyoonia sediminum]|uniref:Molybdopterin or thiamine biosynthesis adenylyltransferase n=1 Tax=Cognatiyoonia sediminum TaxID=1508389 RepID=A0A1M5QUR7_9RHOB|nr:HesA/MoeB/ThiF family protein [Cognatiyoonia sediminum]SHH17894.1 Molybdopterin or thiamine biosynthesis adenylyltransferase [Cognatiyoonia sediminum]
MTRYARQMILPEVGQDGQSKLTKAHALIIGAGGLGHPVAQYLTAAGVGQITIIDPDTVELSNLHRQTLFTEAEVGQPKAQTLCTRLAKLNSDVALKAITGTLNPDTAPELIAAADIILDCADSFAASYIASDECLTQGKPLISASALGLQGYVGGFCGTAPPLRAVFPDLPQHLATCATAGVMGPVVGTLGAMQAQMAINTILGLTPSPLGQLMQVDFATLRTYQFRFDTAPEPDTKLTFTTHNQLTPNDFIVDLRETDEAPTPVAPTALRHQVADFDTAHPTPAKGQRAILTCRSGLRAWQAARKLQSYWDGEILLIAMGDTNTNQGTDT